MTFTMKNEEIQSCNHTMAPDFPKYTSQIINWANQNAQGTRPKIVGQMSDLFPAFLRESDEASIEGWKSWYSERYPDAVHQATEKIYAQVENLRGAMAEITRDMVREWVEDLVFTKTYNGLYVQKAILEKLSAIYRESYRLARPEEESKGIDGYVGNTPYSVKPETYKTMKRLPEEIGVKMVYYVKTKTGLKIEVED